MEKINQITWSFTTDGSTDSHLRFHSLTTNSIFKEKKSNDWLAKNESEDLDWFIDEEDQSFAAGDDSLESPVMDGMTLIRGNHLRIVPLFITAFAIKKNFRAHWRRDFCAGWSNGEKEQN